MKINQDPKNPAPFDFNSKIIDYGGLSTHRSVYAPLDAGSKYDRNINASLYEGSDYLSQNPRAAQEWYRSENQGWTGQLFNGFVSRALSIGPKLGQGFANVVGLIASPFTDEGIKGAFDNTVSNWFASLDEDLRDALPVYKSQKYAEGNFIDKAFSTSFWFDDGFDGLAFLGSALIPGMALGKVGSVAGALGKGGKLAQSIAKGLQTAGSELGISQTAALTTLYNTAAEAGVEAHQTQKQIERELANLSGYDDISLMSAKDQEEIKLIAAERASQTFWWNTAALLAPNLMQSKLFFKGAGNAADDIQRAVRYEGKTAADFVAKPIEYFKKFGQNFASEGLWEENIQSSIQTYESRKAAGLTDDDWLVGPMSNLVNNAWAFSKSVLSLGLAATKPHTSEDEAAAAILLGGMIGGNSALVSTYWENKSRKARAEQEVTLWDKFKKLNQASLNLSVDDNKSFLRTFGSKTITTKDEQGNDVQQEVVSYINPQTGQTEIDPIRLNAYLATTRGNAQAMEESIAATVAGDEVWKEFVNRETLFSHAVRMSSNGSLSKQDFADLVELDPNINGQTAEELGITELVRDNKALALSYYDIIAQSKKEVAKSTDLTTEEGRAFAPVKLRIASYLNWKIATLNDLKASTKTVEGKNQIVEEINRLEVQKQEFVDNESQLREQFGREIFGLRQLANKIKATKDKLAKLTPEDNEAELKESLQMDLAQFEELQQIYGLERMEYGSDLMSNVIGSDASVYSATFQPLQARLQTQDQKSLMTDLFYEIGKTRLNEEKINDTAATGNVDKLIEALAEVRVPTPSTQTAIKDLTTELTNTQQDLKSSFEDLLNVLNDPAEAYGQEFEMPDGTIIDGDAYADSSYEADQTAFEEMKQQLQNQYDEIASRLQTVNGQLSQVNEINDRQQVEQDEYTKLKNAALAGPEELLKALTERFANKKIRDAQIFLAEGQQAMADNKMFLNEAQTQFYIGTLNNLKTYYQKRDDVDQATKDLIIPQIEATIQDLIELYAYIQTWKQTRIEIQEFTLRNQTDMLDKLTGVSPDMLQDGYTPPSPLAQAIHIVMNSSAENKTKLQEFLTALETSDPIGRYKAHQGLIFFVKSQLTAAQLKDLKTNLQEALWNEFIKRFDGKVDEMSVWKNDKQRILPQLLNPAKSLNKFLRRLSKPISDSAYPQVFSSTEGSLSKLIWERDINKLFVLLKTEHSYDPATGRYTLNGESQAVNDQFNEALFFLNFASGVNGVLTTLNSDLDWVKYHNELSKIYSETVTNNTTDAITPSGQQLVVLDQLIISLSSPVPKSTSTNWTESFQAWSVMSGLLGTGKTAVVAKNVVRLLKAINGINSDAIIGTARTEVAAEGVGKSIGTKHKTLEKLITDKDLTGIKYIVLDEAYQLSEEELKALWTLINDFNTTAKTEDRIRVLALGDPSQVRLGDPQFFPLSSISTTSTNDTIALAAIYRTGFTSISNAALAFHLNTKRVTTLSTTANKSLDEIKNSNSADDFFGVVAGSETFRDVDALINLLSKQSSKKRLVIVNNQMEADRITNALPAPIKAAGNVEVRTYDNAQSMTVDQVYLAIDPNKMNAFGQPFDAMTYNTAMYTSIGRAKEFVFLANPDFQTSHMVNDALSKEKENIDLDVEVNKELFKSAIENANVAATTLYGNTAATTEQSPVTTERLDEATYDDPHDNIEEPVIENEIPDPDNSEVQGTPEQQLRKGSEVIKNKDGVDEIQHTLRYPSSSRLINVIKDGTINAGAAVKIIAVASDNKFGVEFKVLGQKSDGKWVVIGVLGEQDLYDPTTGPVIKQLFDSNKDSSRWLPKTTVISNSETGFDLSSRIQASEIENAFAGELAQITSVKFLYDYTTPDFSSSMAEDLLKFHDAFFTEQGFSPATPWFDKDLNPIWNNIAKVAKIAIYAKGTNSTKEDVNTVTWVENNQVSPNFVPKPGVPYLVITDPRTTTSTQAKPTHIYIRLQANKINNTSTQYQTIQKVDDILEKIEKTSNIAYGTEMFEDMVDDLKQYYEVVLEEGRSIIKLKSGVELTEKVQPYLADPAGTDVLASSVTELMNQFFAPINETYVAAKDKAEKFLETLKQREGEAGQNLKLEQIAESNKYRIVDISNGAAHKDWVLSSASSPFQRVINALAKSNRKVDGINIRVSKLMPTGATRRGQAPVYTTLRTGKSILSKQVAKGEFYKPWVEFLVNEHIPAMRNRLVEVGMLDETTWIEDLTKMTRSKSNEGLYHKGEFIESRIERYLNSIVERVKDNPEALNVITQIVQDLNESKEVNRKELLTKYATSPLNRGTLQAMLKTNEKGETSMYTPLLRHNISSAVANDTSTMGINDLGSNLSSEANRAQLGKLLTSKFQGVQLPNVTIKFKHKYNEAPPEQVLRNEKSSAGLYSNLAGFFRDESNWQETSKELLLQELNKGLNTSDPAYQSLIKKIVSRMLEADIKYKTLNLIGVDKWTNSFNSATAAFNNSNKTIYSTLINDFAESSETLLHESIHALVNNSISNPETTEDFVLLERVRELWSKYKEHYKDETLEQLLPATAIPNVTGKELEDFVLREFVAHLFASDTFRTKASAVKLGKSNLFDEFIQAIKQFLGLNKDVNLYEALQWTVDEFLSSELEVESEAVEDTLNFTTDEISKQQHSPLQLAITKLATTEKLHALSDEVAKFTTEILGDSSGSLIASRAVVQLAPLMNSLEVSNDLGKLNKILDSLVTLKTSLDLEQELGQNLSVTSFKVKNVVNAFFTQGLNSGQRAALAVIEKRISGSPTTSQSDTEKLISKLLLAYARNSSAENILKQEFKYLNEQRNKALLDFVKNLYNILTAVTDDVAIQVGDQRMSFVEAIKPSLKQHSAIVSEGFVDLNTGKTIKGFHSVAAYNFVRSFVVDVLADLQNKNLRDDDVSDQLITTAEENRVAARRLVNEAKERLLNETIPQAILDRNKATTEIEQIRAQAKIARLRMQARALEQLNNKTNKSTLFDEIIESIYGTWEIRTVDTEVDIYDEDDGDTVGLRNETMEYESQDMELSLTSSVKEYLNFIPNSSSKSNTLLNKYYSSKKAFVTLAQTFIDYIDMSSILSSDNPIGTWHKLYSELADSNKSPMSSDEIDFIRELDVIVRNSLETQYAYRENDKVKFKDLPSNVRLLILSENPGDTKIVIAIDQRINPNVPLDKLSTDEIEEDSNIKLLGVRNSMKDLVEAMRTRPVFSSYTDVYLLNALYRREKSRRVLTEMANVFSSMTEKSYMLGTYQNVQNGFYKVNYFEARGSGLSQSINTGIRQSIVSHSEVFAPSENTNGLSGILDRQVNKVNGRQDVIAKLKSDKLEDRKLGFNNFLKMFNLTNLVAFQTIKNNIDSAVFTNVAELLKDLHNIPTEMTTDGVIERLNEVNRGRIQSIARVIKTTSELDRSTSITDGRGNRIYRLVPASYFYDISSQFLRVGYSRDAENKLSASSGVGVAALDKFIPQFFFETEYYQDNIFVNSKLQGIYGVTEHDSLRNVNSTRAILFGKETPKEWHTRTFSMAFIDNLTGGIAQVHKYNHFLFQPSDNPRIPAVEIKMLNSTELEEATYRAILQLTKRNKDFLQSVNGKYNPGEYRMFSILKDYIKPDTTYTEEDFKQIAKQVVERLFTGPEVEQYINDFIKSEPIVPAKVGEVYKNLLSGGAARVVQKDLKEVPKDLPPLQYARAKTVKVDNKEIILWDIYENKSKFASDPYLKSITEKEGNKFDEEIALMSVSKEYESDVVRKAYDPILRLAFANYYVNGYHLNQLFTGQYDQYKNVEDVVKRMAGVLAPGIKPLVSPWTSRKTYNLGIIQDTEVKGTAEQPIPEKMLEFVKKFHAEVITDERAKELLQFFSAFKTTDAQGFVSKRRIRELKSSYGVSYNIGNVLKPVYFGTHVHETLISESDTEIKPTKFTTVKKVQNEDGSIVYQEYRKDPRSVYVKYSAVHLEDSLVAKYPELGVFNKYMEDNDMDEMLFPSAIKVGGVNSNMFTVEDTETLRKMYGELQGEQKLSMGDKNMRLIPLENRFYKMQFNPVAKYGDNKVTAPSQLPYFTNILGHTIEQADIAFAAHTAIVNEQLEKITKQLTSEVDPNLDRSASNTDRKAIESKIRNAVLSTLGAPGSKGVQMLLKAGVSMSNPIVFDKVITQIMSQFSSKGLAIKFPGGKLVLQSDEGITNPRTGKPLEYNTENKLPYAEVILPLGMLSDDMQIALDRGESIYLTPDFLGFRIPTTEIHSAVPMKVVGTYDSKGTNVIIAPQTLVYLHGSDFDVDSLFVISRSTVSKSTADFLGINKEIPIGYVTDPDTRKLVFTGNDLFNPKKLLEVDQKINESIEEYYLRLVQERTANLIKKYAELSAEKDQADSRTLKLLNEEIKAGENAKHDLIIALNKNRMFEAYASVLQSPVTASRMLTPILMSYFNDTSLEQSVAARLQKLDSRLWQSDSLKDLNNLNTSIDAFVAMQSGVRLTGVFANVVKVLAYLQRTSSAKNLNLRGDKIFKYKIGDTEHTINKLSDVDLSNPDILTWTYLDALINLAIDNLKELTLGKLNITINNSNEFSALIALGLPPYDVALMFKTELVSSLKNTSKFYKAKARNEIFKKYLDDLNIELREGETPVKFFEGMYGKVVLSTSDLETLVKKQLNGEAYTREDLPKLAALDEIIQKAAAIGESIMYTSWAMGPIRGLPTKEEATRNLERSLREVFKNPNSIGIKSNNPIRNGFEVRDSYAFAVDDMFKTLPHFKKALEVYYKAKELVDFSTVITSERFLNASKKLDVGRYLTPYAQRGFDDLSYRNELISYLHSSISYEYLHNLQPFKDGSMKRRTVSRYMTALSDQLYRLIDSVNKIEANEASKLGEEYIPNEFLRNLNVERIAGRRPSFRMANLDPSDDVSRLKGEDGFVELGKYDIEEIKPGNLITGYRISEKKYWVRPFKVSYDSLNLLQRHLLAYVMAAKDVRYTKTSYVHYIPAKLIKDEYDNKYYGLIQKIDRELQNGNSRLLNSIADDFLISFAAKHLDLMDNIGSYSFKKAKEAGKEGKERYIKELPVSKTVINGVEVDIYSGSEQLFGKTIHFDKKFLNKYYSVESLPPSMNLGDTVKPQTIFVNQETKHPAYLDFPLIAVKQEPVYRDGEYIGREPILFIRLNDPVVSEFVYYRKIGKPIMENYFSRIQHKPGKNIYRFVDAFNPEVKEVMVFDTQADFIETRSTLTLNETIQITNYDDLKRYYSRRVKATKLVSVENGINKYVVEEVNDIVNENNKQSYGLEDILDIDVISEQPTNDINLTIDEKLNDAISNIDPEFERIVNIGAQWEVPTDDSNVYRLNGLSIDRVTSNRSGILNQMRAKQWREDWSWGKVKSDQMWRNTSPDTVLDTEFGKVNKDDYAAKVDERSDKNRLRGSIIHAILQKHATSDPIKLAEIQNKIDSWMIEAGYESNWFNWLDKPANYERVFKKAGLNIYDDGVPAELRDKVQMEVTITDTRYLKMGGTIDMLIKKSNGRYAIRDFTFGSNFHNSSEAPPFKYGIAPNMTIWANPKNSKKLQMMWYAFMMRLENPEIRFEDLEVIYLPNKDNITTYDSSSKVEVSEFLYMIREYLKNEKPEVLEQIKSDFNARFGERGKAYFDSLFNSMMYDSSNETEAQAIVQDKELRAQLDSKLEELRTYMLFDFQMEQPTGPAWILNQKSVKAQENKPKATQVFKEILTLLNDDKLNTRNARDISFMSMWLASNANQNSPFIQVYDKFLKERKIRANERIEKTFSTFKALIRPVIEDYERVHGKDPFGSIPILKGKLNFYDTRKMWDWLYTEVQNPNGTVTEKIRTTEAEWAAIQSDPNYASYGNWEARKQLAKFMVDTYGSFFKNNGSNVALANRVATMHLDTSGNEVVWKPISNLALHNHYRNTERESAPFNYYEGWFPKVQKMMEEFKGPLHAEYWDQIKKRYLTLEEDHEYEDIFNNVEAIPMKYLGTQSIELSKNYSRSAEWQFMKFLRNSILKEELDDVFALGRGMMEYLQQEQRVDKNTSYSNTVNYLRTAIDMQVRNLKQRNFPGGFVARNEGFTRSEYGHLYKLDFLKMIQSFKTLAAGPVMWLKPIQGSANAVFAYLVTLKDGLKNSIIRSVNDKFLGVDGDQMAFTFSDVMWATKEWKNLQVAAMKGELYKDKTFLLAKYLGYMPNNYAWYSEKDSLTSVRNKIFDASTLYMFHSMGEEAVAIITMLAQLKSMKVKSTGKSIYEHYKVEDEIVDGVKVPRLVWDGTERGLMRKADGTIEPLKELTTNEIRRMFFVYESIHGGYRADEKIKMEYYIFGEMLMQFKRYIPAILKNVWRSQGEVQAWGYYKYKGDMQDGKEVVEWHARVMEGRWKVLGKLLLASILPKYWEADNQSAPNAFNRTLSFLGLKKFATENYRWSNLNEYQREIVMDSVITLFMFLSLAAGGAVAFNDFDDDDPFVKWMRRIQGNLFQQWNPYELGKDLLAANGVTNIGRQAWGLMSGVYDMTIAGLMYPINPEASVTKEGTLKGLNNIMKHTPFVASAYDIYKAASKSEDPESFWNRIIIRP